MSKATSNRYRPVDTKTAADPKVCALSSPPSARMLWYHLVTCGHDRSIPGLLVIGLGALADELGWSPDDVRARFAEIEERGMAIADWRSRVIWLPKAIAPGRNEPRAPNNVTHLGGREWADVPDCELKWRAFGAFVDYCATRGPVYLDAAISAFPVPDEARSHAESLRKSRVTKRKLVPNQPTNQSQSSPEPTSPSTSSSTSSSRSTSTSRSEEEEDLAPRSADAASTPEPVRDPEPEDPVVETFMVVGGQEWHLRASLAKALRETYLAVDFETEIREARMWCIANATKRKTPAGMPRFLQGWFKRQQDRGGSSARAVSRPLGPARTGTGAKLDAIADAHLTLDRMRARRAPPTRPADLFDDRGAGGYLPAGGDRG